MFIEINIHVYVDVYVVPCNFKKKVRTRYKENNGRRKKE